MFGIEASEYLLLAVVALVVIGPKDLPKVMRAVGSWIARARRTAGHVRAGMDELMRQADLSVDRLPTMSLSATPAQAASLFLTPDTRSREPGGARSIQARLQPGALAASLTPIRAPEVTPVFDKQETKTDQLVLEFLDVRAEVIIQKEAPAQVLASPAPPPSTCIQPVRSKQ